MFQNLQSGRSKEEDFQDAEHHVHLYSFQHQVARQNLIGDPLFCNDDCGGAVGTLTLQRRRLHIYAEDEKWTLISLRTSRHGPACIDE